MVVYKTLEKFGRLLRPFSFLLVLGLHFLQLLRVSINFYENLKISLKKYAYTKPWTNCLNCYRWFSQIWICFNEFFSFLTKRAFLPYMICWHYKKNGRKKLIRNNNEFLVSKTRYRKFMPEFKRQNRKAKTKLPYSRNYRKNCKASGLMFLTVNLMDFMFYDLL